MIDDIKDLQELFGILKSPYQQQIYMISQSMGGEGLEPPTTSV
jgi:hypothetical protein